MYYVYAPVQDNYKNLKKYTYFIEERLQSRSFFERAATGDDVYFHSNKYIYKQNCWFYGTENARKTHQHLLQITRHQIYYLMDVFSDLQ